MKFCWKEFKFFDLLLEKNSKYDFKKDLVR